MNGQLKTVNEDWYRRLHALREVWQDESETDQRKKKAKRLWFEMCQRLFRFLKVYNDAMSKHVPPFESGTSAAVPPKHYSKV